MTLHDDVLDTALADTLGDFNRRCTQYVRRHGVEPLHAKRVREAFAPGVALRDRIGRSRTAAESTLMFVVKERGGEALKRKQEEKKATLDQLAMLFKKDPALRGQLNDLDGWVRVEAELRVVQDFGNRAVHHQASTLNMSVLPAVTSALTQVVDWAWDEAGIGRGDTSSDGVGPMGDDARGRLMPRRPKTAPRGAVSNEHPTASATQATFQGNAGSTERRTAAVPSERRTAVVPNERPTATVPSELPTAASQAAPSPRGGGGRVFLALGATMALFLVMAFAVFAWELSGLQLEDLTDSQPSVSGSAHDATRRLPNRRTDQPRK